MSSSVPLLHWADYTVLGLVLLCSVGVGFFQWHKQRGKHGVEDYLMADRKLPLIPVACSVFVTMFSSVSSLGDPTEVNMNS